MKTLILIGILLLTITIGCQKEHAKYRFTPKYHVGDLVQFEKSIEHDYASGAYKRMWDIPQPFTIDSFYYNETWRDNWYYVTWADGTVDSSAIDELQLQKWNGKLQK